MGFRDSLRELTSEWYQGTKRKLQARGRPNTRVDSGGSKSNYSFDGQNIDRGTLRDIKEIRESGGVISHLVHAKALMQFGTGAEFQSEGPRIETDEGEEIDPGIWLEEQFNNLDNLLINLGEDAIWYPHSIAEIVETQGGSFSHIEPVEPWTILPQENEFGEVIAWEQQISGDFGSQSEIFEPDEIASFILNKSCARDKTGISEVLRAEEEVMQFRENREAVNQAIEIAGFPHHIWKVGREGAGVIDDNELRRVRNRVDSTEGDTQFVMGRDIDHDMIQPGDFKFEAIQEHDLRELALALGLPLELANVGSDGLGSGMPAELRLQLFERQARAAQRSLAGQFVEEVCRPVLEQYSPFSGDVDLTLRFGDPVSDEAELSERQSYMTVNEVRNEIGLPEETDEEIAESYRKPANIEAPEEEEPEDGGIGGLFGEEDGTGNRTLSEDELRQFEEAIERIHTDFVTAEDTSLTLTEFSESQLPEMVKERMKQAIRSGAVFSHFDELPSSELMDLRQSLSDMLTDDEWSLDNMADELSNRFDVSEDKAETWARTETQSIANHAYEDAILGRQEEREEEFKFKWVGSTDDRTTDACLWLLEQTNPKHGGDPVSLERLKELIQESVEHDDDINTEPREFTPHINCRKRYVRVVE